MPTTPYSVAEYLAHYAGALSIETLRQRLAALAQWHIENVFPDPTKDPLVRKVIRGIQVLHPTHEQRREPLQLYELEKVVRWLDAEILAAVDRGDLGIKLRRTRDKALVLLGFWRGFRGAELTRLRIEQIIVVPGEGFTCAQHHAKDNHRHHGRTFKVPALSRLCPVDAYIAWIAAAHLSDGLVFRSFDRWGRVNERGLRPESLIGLLRTIFASAGVESADCYSGHSMRPGFANWATSNGWDLNSLMEYVGWNDVQSAMHYVDGVDSFTKQRIEAALLSTAKKRTPMNC